MASASPQQFVMSSTPADLLPELHQKRAFIQKRIQEEESQSSSTLLPRYQQQLSYIEDSIFQAEMTAMSIPLVGQQQQPPLLQPQEEAPPSPVGVKPEQLGDTHNNKNNNTPVTGFVQERMSEQKSQSFVAGGVVGVPSPEQIQQLLANRGFLTALQHQTRGGYSSSSVAPAARAVTNPIVLPSVLTAADIRRAGGNMGAVPSSASSPSATTTARNLHLMAVGRSEQGRSISVEDLEVNRTGREEIPANDRRRKRSRSLEHRELDSLVNREEDEADREQQARRRARFGGGGGSSGESTPNMERSEEKISQVGSLGERLHPCLRVFPECGQGARCHWRYFPYNACLRMLKKKYCDIKRCGGVHLSRDEIKEYKEYTRHHGEADGDLSEEGVSSLSRQQVRGGRQGGDADGEPLESSSKGSNNSNNNSNNNVVVGGGGGGEDKESSGGGGETPRAAPTTLCADTKRGQIRRFRCEMTLFMDNLPLECESGAVLLQAFGKYGRASKVRSMRRQAIVEFESEMEAMSVLREFNGKNIFERPVRIRLATRADLDPW